MRISENRLRSIIKDLLVEDSKGAMTTGPWPAPEASVEKLSDKDLNLSKKLVKIFEDKDLSETIYKLFEQHWVLSEQEVKDLENVPFELSEEEVKKYKRLLAEKFYKVLYKAIKNN